MSLKGHFLSNCVENEPKKEKTNIFTDFIKLLQKKLKKREVKDKLSPKGIKGKKKPVKKQLKKE